MKTLTLTTGLLAASLTLLATQSVSATPEDWQEHRLFEPTPVQLVAELKGHITIYDGLHERVVQRAMDREFERIENMMFIRVKQTEPDGGETVQDDGC